jgi:hypothetical protein
MAIDKSKVPETRMPLFCDSLESEHRSALLGGDDHFFERASMSFP